MVLETLFCVGFFLTPVLGMIVMVIHAAVKTTVKADTSESQRDSQRNPQSEPLEETSQDKVPVWNLRKKIEDYPIPRFENQNIFAYQLVEGRIHKGFQKNKFRRGAHPRAGP